MQSTDPFLRWVFWSIVCVGLLVAGAIQAGEPQATESPSGRGLYERHCSACHGLEGTGRTPLSMLLRTPPADLTQIAARRGGLFDEAVVVEIIDGRMPAHGARDMPVWGRVLDREEIVAIARHLRTIQLRKTAALTE